MVLLYILDRGRIKDKYAFLEEVKLDLSEKIGEKMGTIVEDFWREGLVEGLEKGREEGMEKGIEKVAKRLLEKHETLATVAELTGLSIARIMELQEQINS